MATVTGVNGLMDTYRDDWGQVPEDTPTKDQPAAEARAAAVATLRIEETMGFSMDRDTATRAQLPDVTTYRVSTPARTPTEPGPG